MTDHDTSAERLPLAADYSFTWRDDVPNDVTINATTNPEVAAVAVREATALLIALRGQTTTGTTMTDTTPAVCRFAGCDDDVYAAGICREHYEAFEGPLDAEDAVAPTGQPADTAPAADTRAPGRLRLTPLHAVVRSYFDGSSVIAVLGVYGTPELAKKGLANLSELGIPDKLEVVPFYEVTP